MNDDELHHSVAREMVAQGLLQQVDSDSIEAFAAGDGLRLLFFAGPRSVRREGHDVAVALRELLREYRDLVATAWVAPDAEAALQEQYRAGATPCLVFLLGGEVLEVLPRVRDWGDYAAVFRRYLGEAAAAQVAGAAR